MKLLVQLAIALLAACGAEARPPVVDAVDSHVADQPAADETGPADAAAAELPEAPQACNGSPLLCDRPLD